MPTSVSFYNFGDSSFTDSGFCWIRVDQLEEIHPRLDLRILNCWATDYALRTPDEYINQRNLKFWADVADKICFSRTYKFGIGV